MDKSIDREKLNEKSYKELLLGEFPVCDCKFCTDIRQRKINKDIDEFNEK